MDTISCINNQEWINYSQNKLLPKQLEQLNTHCATCEICSDIKLGIDLMASKSELNSINTQIHVAVDSRTKSVARVIKLRYWLAMAATVLITITTGLFIYKLKKHEKAPEIALIKPTPSDKPISDEAVTKLALTKPKSTIKKSKPGLAKPKTLTENNLPKEAPKDPPLERTITRTEALAEADGQKLDEIEVAPQSNKESVTSVPTAAKIPSSKRKLPEPYSANNNMQLENNLIRHTEWLPNAEMQFNQQAWDSCLTLCRPYLAGADSTSISEALFLSAKCYLKKGDINLAKSYLIKCQLLEGPKQKEAKKLLKKLP